MLRDQPAVRVLLLIAFMTLSGCFSLSRDAPTERYFVLGGDPVIESEPQAEDLAGVGLGLRQVHLAEYLRSPLIVVRRGTHQITFSEFNRWGEDLGAGINRTVAGYLRHRADFRNIDIVPWPPRSDHDYLVQLQLLRFEGVVPEGTTGQDGEVHLLAAWEIIAQPAGAVVARGTTDYRATDWRVGDYETLVTILEMGLRQLSDELIAGLRTVVSP